MYRFIIFFAIVGLFCAHYADSAPCACAIKYVNVRSGPGTYSSKLTTLSPGECLPYRRYRYTVGRTSWVKVDYHGQNGWIHKKYVRIKSCQPSRCPKIITRAEWGARAPKSPHRKLELPVKYMFIHHSASGFCYNRKDCTQKVRSFQNFHMDTYGWADIGYSFVVGEDGNVYEARGWDGVGAHTRGYNSVGLAICVIGDFTYRAPNAAAQRAVKQLLACGVAEGKLDRKYILRAHRDVKSTKSPGQAFYELIQKWPHYSK